MKAFFKWLLLTLVMAVSVHLATVWVFPYGVMALVAKKGRAQYGARINSVLHAPPTTPAQRNVVRPSPELLYSLIRFDLNKGPLHITAPFPTDTYGSLSFYSLNTVNFFTINDRQAKTNPLEIYLIMKGSRVPEVKSALVIESPSKKGVVLARLLIRDADQVAHLMKVRKRMTCSVLNP